MRHRGALSRTTPPTCGSNPDICLTGAQPAKTGKRANSLAEVKVPHAAEESAPFEDPFSGVMVALHSVVCSEELLLHRWRSPDYESENRALMKLADALATSPSHILQNLVETVLEATDCDSSGVCLLMNVDGQKRLCWPAAAGLWGASAAVECLKAPFRIHGIEIGAVWAVMQSDRRMFDAEDERLVVRLGRFASLTYQSLRAIEELRSEIVARDKMEARVRELAEGLNEAPLLELAHANRLATGQLSVSIAHELNEPIAAAVANADAALHWLDARPPSLDRARQALGRILGNGHRASQIIAGMTTNVSI
jgi:His Kinase A (phospho-acceptor) domain